jgi:hypothetical protein
MISVDVIKAAYRQTKEGFAVTFILHPQDDFDLLAHADIGSQWQMQLVPLDDNGNAKEVISAQETQPAPTEPASSALPAVARALCVAEAMGNGWCIGKCQNPKDCSARPQASHLVQQAGICCSDPVFRQFLYEHEMLVDITTANKDEAATAVRMICHVQSRREFIPGTPAGDRWEALYGQFLAWRDIPEFAA